MGLGGRTPDRAGHVVVGATVSLPRRTPLKRGTSELKRTPLPKRTKRLSYRSKKREAEAAERFIVRSAVFARDHWRCQMPPVLARHNRGRDTAGPCMGELTYHHLHKEGQGGAYTLDNGLSLCARHNTWVEDHPLTATELGLVRRG